ncbi:MAG: geranylgeranylglycerol-phosphate geranylgeranyltransferase [Bacteroidales bacterium]|jgi:4-hydroxybenzoate polyprenyltransferase|nr:geranylgeranylglycerol-phosphate geranylgeranyltransferase [Bacteroidales bacterium]
MRPFLTLIRLPNLLIIAFTEYMMRYAVVQPLIRQYGFEFQLSDFTFFCLVVATICTAAAGYAINDYFDVKTDMINRPDKVIVGKSINRRRVMMIHIIFCIAGIVLGGYVTWRAGVPQLVILFIVVAGMLWLYSFIYKRQFLIGNLIVSLFTSLVPMMVLLDIPSLNRVYRQELLDAGTNLNMVIFWIFGFSIFAFLSTLSREIVKDTEDFEGDKAYGCRSVSIVLGTSATKWIIISINMVMVVTLGYVFWKFLRYDPDGTFNYLSFFYLLVLIIFPLLWVNRNVCKANDSNDYRKISNWMKWIMLAGILYSIPGVLCQQANTHHTRATSGISVPNDKQGYNRTPANLYDIDQPGSVSSVIGI